MVVMVVDQVARAAREAMGRWVERVASVAEAVVAMAEAKGPGAGTPRRWRWRTFWHGT